MNHAEKVPSSAVNKPSGRNLQLAASIGSRNLDNVNHESRNISPRNLASNGSLKKAKSPTKEGQVSTNYAYITFFSFVFVAARKHNTKRNKTGFILYACDTPDLNSRVKNKTSFEFLFYVMF